MPDVIVTARELRYDKKPHLRGARLTVSEKDAKLLKALHKVEDAPPAKPVRKVAETKPAPQVEPAPEPAPEPIEEVKPTARAMTTDDVPSTRGRYSNRALKSDD
jgi:outer membrane biosynthesis protein TonB